MELNVQRKIIFVYLFHFRYNILAVGVSTIIAKGDDAESKG
jgi:hypothetical protein